MLNKRDIDKIKEKSVAPFHRVATLFCRKFIYLKGGIFVNRRNYFCFSATNEAN